MGVIFQQLKRHQFGWMKLMFLLLLKGLLLFTCSIVVARSIEL